MSVLDRARELATEILESSELNEMRNTEKTMLNDEDAQKLIQEFKDKQKAYQLVKSQGKELTESQQQEVDDLETRMLDNPLILDYFRAQQNFENMLGEINNIIAGAISGGECECSDDCCTSCDSDCNH